MPGTIESDFVFENNNKQPYAHPCHNYNKFFYPWGIAASNGRGHHNYDSEAVYPYFLTVEWTQTELFESLHEQTSQFVPVAPVV